MKDDLSVCDVFNLDFCRPPNDLGGRATSADNTIRLELPRSAQDQGCLEADEKRVAKQSRKEMQTGFIVAVGVLASVLVAILLG